MSEIHVAKLGGSLLDLPDLMERFDAWRRAEFGVCGLLVVGGGTTADLVRDAGVKFKMDEEKAHWLAIRAMQFNAHLIRSVLPDAAMVRDLSECEEAWTAEKLAVVEPWEWLSKEDAAGIRIPHRWNFTSDSVAGHVATRLGAARLTLLKSTLPSAERTKHGVVAGGDAIEAASRAGVVDGDFPMASRGVPSVRLVNLRAIDGKGFAGEVLR